MTTATSSFLLFITIFSLLYTCTDAALGSECDQLNPCPDVHEVCDGGLCICKNGFTDVVNTCVKNGTLDTPCDIDDPTTCIKIFSTCDANSSTCQCQTGYAKSLGDCVEDGRPGAPCLIDANLPCIEHKTSYCFEDICVCIENHTLVANHKCKEDGRLRGICLVGETQPCLDNNTACDEKLGRCFCILEYNRISGECFRNCSDTLPVENGVFQIIPITEPQKYFAAEYTCNEGFDLVGISTLQCLDNGTYAGEPPVCVLSTMTSTTTNPPPQCSSDCLNGGSCTLDQNNTYSCVCPPGYSGTSCEIEDLCATKSCPETAIDCIARPENSPPDRVCICPLGFKGENCDIVDTPIACNAVNKTVYFDISIPPTGYDTLCLPKGTTTTADDICYNPDEGIVYGVQIDATQISVDDGSAAYCLTVIDQNPKNPVECIDVIAFEADDVSLRTWINSTFSVCFVFNNPPQYNGPADVTFNVDVDTSKEIQLLANDIDVHQTRSFTILNILPEDKPELTNFITVAGQLLVINTPDGQLLDPVTNSLEATVNIRVNDGGIPALTADGQILVTFVNESLSCTVDNDPILFHLIPFPEASTKIGEITCQESSGRSTTYSYKISDPVPIEVQDDGFVYYNPSIQDNMGIFDVNVEITAIATTEVSTILSFVVIADNFTPNCTQINDQILFSEKAKVGDCSSVLYSCSDPGQLSKACTGGSALFNIECEILGDGLTGVKVCVKSSLEHNPGVFPVTVNVANTYANTDVTFDVNVANVNDPPIIVRDNGINTLEFTLLETESVNYVVTTLAVDDPDIGITGSTETLDVTLTDTIGGPIPFSASLNEGQNAITVVISSTLDPSTKHDFTLTLTVSDSVGASDVITLNIKLNDTNEAPKCTEMTKNVNASVQDVADYVITGLSCSDNDFTADFSTITYTLTGDDNIISYFKVDTNGVVSLAKSLADFTTSDTMLTFNVEVEDGGGLLTMVTINVQVSNSFPPDCDAYAFTKGLSETTLANVCFSITTNCVDPVKDEALVYSMNSGSDTQFFGLNPQPQTSTVVSLCVSNDLQGNYGDYLLVVIVSSSYGERQIRITISVSDVNNPPVFTEDMYNSNVFENTAMGIVVLTVTANDEDSGPYGQVVYQLHDAQNMFMVNSSTGAIRVMGVLDAEVESSVTFFISAGDTTPTALSTTTTIQIEIRDVNDNPPQCTYISSSVTVGLLASVGTRIATLSCTDADISDAFSQLRYRISPPSTLFSVNETGHVTVADKLPKDEQQHVIGVEVSDESGNPVDALKEYVTITVDVNTAVPPECTMYSISKDLQELDTVGRCPTSEVTCQDPVGGSVTLMSQNGSALPFLEIRKHEDASTLGLTACIKSSLKDQFGTFELAGVVSNGLATAEVKWTFTIFNVNEPPAFNPEQYETHVAEETTSGSTAILTVTVSDPDQGTDDQTFKLDTTSESLTNNADFDNAFSDSILYIGESFYLAKAVNATIRNLFVYTVTAYDKEGLSSTAQVLIHVDDVNSAPICNPNQLSFATNILADIGTPLIPLSCYDSDIDPENIHLDYLITAGDTDDYFNVTESGMLVVIKQLPRTRLYSTGKATLSIAVSDRGTPSLSTTSTVTVTVDNNIPAECTLGVTPPDIWVEGECTTITMDCTDPTTDDSGHLTYTPEGNFTAGFTLKSNEQGVIVICYNRRTSGYFEISVKVYNGLTTALFKEVIFVDYEKATPVFNSTQYTKSLMENVQTNTVAISVAATSANLIGDLVYHMDNADSTTGWNNYFSLDQSSGVITIIASLKPIANQEIILKLEAEDTGSKLRSSTQVELTIIDINEVPSCTILDSNIQNIDVDSPIGTTILSFNCSDVDVKDEFKTLSYILTPDAIAFFEIKDTVATPPGKLLITKVELDVAIAAYPVTLTVKDSGQPALEFDHSFDVTVNLLPPPLNVEVTVLDHDLIAVDWSYHRLAYYQVTNSFRITLQQDGASERIINIPSADKRSHNVSGLTAQTTYEVSVTAITTYGNVASTGIQVTTPHIPVLNYLTFTIHALDISYDSRLRNNETQLYYSTTQNIIQQLELVLNDQTQGYVELEITGIRPASSVYIDMVITMDILTGNIQNTLDVLDTAVKSGWIRDLSVNSSYFVAAEGAGYVAIEGDVISSADEIYNGTDVTLTCNIVTIGYPIGATFKYWWTYRGVELKPSSTSRYTIRNSVGVLPEYKTSVLGIRPIQINPDPLEIRRYSCHVSDADDQQTAEKEIQIRVIPQPTVLISPSSITVSFGASVNVTCMTITPLSIFDQFVWYKDGQLFTQTSNEDFATNDTRMTLMVKRIETNTVFGCEGVNKAGTGHRVFSYINVLPDTTDGNEDKLCPENVDGRGNTWPDSSPESVVTFPCQAGFTGLVYRVCSVTGVWKMPVYDCVRENLEQIEDAVNAIKDGSSKSNLTNELDKLATETTDTDLFDGDIDITLNTLDIVVLINDETTGEIPQSQTDDFLEVASNLIDERNKQSWVSRIEAKQEGAIDIPGLVEQFLRRKFDDIQDQQQLNVKNIHVNIGKGERSSYEFPDRSEPNLPQWLKDTQTGIRVPIESFKDIPNLNYASSFYRSITPILVKTLKRNGKFEDIEKTLDINSDLVGFQTKNQNVQISPPAEITFQHRHTNYSDPVCVYWDFTEQAFLTDGCEVLSTSDDKTVCACNHFTNFAILMSPGKTPEADIMALSIISAVGCAISILCLLLTIIAHLLVWRYVKSDRAVLLLNLCVALVISYAIFLGGVGRADNETVCTVIAALLHFFYLAVFFLMLAYGIEIAVSVIYVFVTRSRLKYLLPCAWGIPLVIVGVTLGITQTKGYGNEEFCWLSIEDGVLWAFVAPALLIILINLLIVIAVLRQMFKSSAMMTKSDKEKAKTGVRSICVLLPILGLTWVFGIFSVNRDFVAFQYLFAIFNTLQGLFIFLFHCIFNSQIREGLKQRRRRKKSLASIENTFKHQHSSSTGSTAFIPSEVNSTTAIGKDPNGGTSNPFLEADRQMKELVAKQKKGGANIYDNNAANNKIDKDKPAKAVDLDDVKISNLLRESGTAGVSSILQAGQKPEPEVETRTPQESNLKRQSKMSEASSKRYDYIDPSNMNQSTSGYEKYMQPSQRSSGGYDKVQKRPDETTSSHHSSSHSGTDKSKKREQERQRELEKEREYEKQRKADHEKRDKERRDYERKEKERANRERKEMEKERERERERAERNRQPNTICIGYEMENPGYSSHEQLNKPHSKSNRSSRSDDDYQARVVEHQVRMSRVYMPYAHSSRRGVSSSAQNITSISTAIPQKYDPYQGGKKLKDSTSSKRSGDSLPKKKERKKSSLKDRSKAYEYQQDHTPYESTYLGGQSRHASLEQMNMQPYGYSPYSHMPGMGGYQTGRPTSQQQHWDQYRYQHQQQNPYGPRDHGYW